MSREVAGTAVDGDPATGPRARLAALAGAGRRTRLLAALAATAAAALAVAALTLPGGTDDPDRRGTTLPAPTGPTTTTATPTPDLATLPADSRLFVRVTPAGRDGADLTHVQATVELRNAGGVDRVVEAVAVLGLGTALVDRPADRLLPAGGGTVRLAATISADCTARVRRDLAVRVTEVDRKGLPFEVTARLLDLDGALRVLDPLCPPVFEGVAVAVTATRPAEDGSVAVRLVNRGLVEVLVVDLAGPDAGSLRLVADPPLPYDLDPGEAVVATLDVRGAPGTRGCPAGTPAAAARVLTLEGRTPNGYVAVRGLPTASLEVAVRRHLVAAGCPTAG